MAEARNARQAAEKAARERPGAEVSRIPSLVPVAAPEGAAPTP